MAVYPSDNFYPGNTDAYPGWYARTGWDQTTDSSWSQDNGTAWTQDDDDAWEQS